jgi:hypothetical protein
VREPRIVGAVNWGLVESRHLKFAVYRYLHMTDRQAGRQAAEGMSDRL